MKLIDADALKQAILSIMPERSEVLLIIDNQPDAITLLKEQQAEIERLKEKDRLHCEDCAYNGICETPHTDKSPLCAEYSIVR